MVGLIRARCALCPEYVPRWASDLPRERGSAAADGPRVQSRAHARAVLVREIPAARRPASPEEARSGVGGAGETGRRVLDEAPSGGLASRHARRCSTRNASGSGAHRRHVRRRRRRMAALRLGGSRRKALDTHHRSVAARLVDVFGSLPIEEMTAQRIEHWRAGLGADRERPLTNRTRNKSLTILGGIMERATRVYGLLSNPVRDVEKLRERYDATRFDFYSSEEVWALVRAAASEQDGAIFLTAAYTGLRRGELIAMHWRDVDFDRSAVRVAGSYDNGKLTARKSGHGVGWAIEPRKPRSSGCRRSQTKRKAISATALSRVVVGPCAVREPGHARRSPCPRTGKSRGCLGVDGCPVLAGSELERFRELARIADLAGRCSSDSSLADPRRSAAATLASTSVIC